MVTCRVRQNHRHVRGGDHASVSYHNVSYHECMVCDRSWESTLTCHHIGWYVGQSNHLLNTCNSMGLAVCLKLDACQGCELFQAGCSAYAAGSCSNMCQVTPVHDVQLQGEESTLQCVLCGWVLDRWGNERVMNSHVWRAVFDGCAQLLRWGLECERAMHGHE